jgi:predicted PurR-regulated permease PerM
MRAVKKRVELHADTPSDPKPWSDGEDHMEDGAATLHVQAASSHQPRLNILTALAIIAFLYFARPVILPVLLAAVGAMALKPVIKWLEGWHLPRALAAGITLAILLCATGIGFIELSQPAMKWISNAPQNVGQLRQRVEKYLPTEKIKQATDILSETGTGSKTNSAPAMQVKTPSDNAGKAINWTAGFLGSLIETIILLYMFLVMGEAFLNKIFDGDGSREKHRALNISNEVQQTISHYLFTVSLINFTLGTLVGTGLYFLGVPNAVLWGLLAALLNYIPYFGPIVGIIIIAAVGFLTVDTLPKNILPAAWYLLLHLAEADFITPVLLGRHFTINPLVIFIALLFGVWLWGVLGALLAVPVLIALKVLCQRVPAFAFGNRFL